MSFLVFRSASGKRETFRKEKCRFAACPERSEGKAEFANRVDSKNVSGAASHLRAPTEVKSSVEPYECYNEPRPNAGLSGAIDPPGDMGATREDTADDRR